MDTLRQIGQDYELRLHLENVEIDVVCNHLKSDETVIAYIVAKEVGKNGREHFHCYIRFNYVLTEKDVKSYRKSIKQTYGLTDGNASYSFKGVRKTTALIYNLKDGNYKSYGFSNSIISILGKMSYKTDLKAFQDTLTEIEYQFMNDAISAKGRTIAIHQRKAWSRFLDLKCQYNQKPNKKVATDIVELWTGKLKGISYWEEQAHQYFPN